MSKRGSLVLRLIYAAGAIGILILPWLSVEQVLDRYLYDDTFYYLKVAENIFEGHGAALDGVATTNGFHPLWMIACVFLRGVGGHGLALHWVSLLGACLHLAQVLLLYRIITRAHGAAIAHAAALFYMFNYRILATNLCGLETPLVALFVLLIFGSMTTFHASGRSLEGIRLGVFLGFAVLARFDQLLLALFVPAWLCVDSNLGRVEDRLKTAAVAAGTVLVVLFPWFAWSYSTSNTLLPNSRNALHLFAFPNYDVQAPAEMMTQVGTQLSAASRILPDTMNLLGLWPIVLPSHPTWVSGLLVVCLGALAWLVRTSPPMKSSRVGAAALLYGLLHLAYYLLFATAEVRYLIPFSVATILGTALIVGEWFRRSATARAKTAVTVVFVVLMANNVTAGIQAWGLHQAGTRNHELLADLYDAALWLSENTPKNIVVGSWNAGILSYYSGRQVVNLDGVINDQVIGYLRRHKLEDYIEQRGIDLVVDFESQIPKFMNLFGGRDDWPARFTPIVRLNRIVVLKRSPSVTSHSTAQYP